MQVVSSMTITPPEPAMLPAAMRELKSMATSISSALRIFAEMPPGMTALSSIAIAHTARSFDEMPQGHTHRLLVDAGPDHVPAHAEEPCAALTVGTKGGKALGSMAQDEWDAGQRLDVVDDGGAREETGNGGERRLDPGKALATFERGQQRGLFAADVGSGPAMNDYVQVETRSLGCSCQASPHDRPHRWRAGSASPAGSTRPECRHRPYDCRWHRLR